MKTKSPSKKKGKIKSEEKQETKLEKDIEKVEEKIERMEEIEQGIRINEFLPITDSKAPVLERIIQREIPVQSSQIEIEQRERTDDRRVDYAPVSNAPNYGFARNTANTDDDERKYETAFVPPVLSRVETARNMRQEFIRPQTGIWNDGNEQQTDIEFMQTETKLPFEEQQKKYRRFKPQ